MTRADFAFRVLFGRPGFFHICILVKVYEKRLNLVVEASKRADYFIRSFHQTEKRPTGIMNALVLAFSLAEDWLER